MKREFYLASIGVILAAAPVKHSLANTQLWSVDVVAGRNGSTEVDDPPSARLRFAAAKEFGVADNQNVTLFGGSKAPICYSSDTPQELEKIGKQRTDFLQTPISCDKAAPLFQYMMNAAPRENHCSSDSDYFLDFDKDGKSDVQGPATSSGLRSSLRSVLQSAPPGSHLMLNIRGHGISTGRPPVSAVNLGNPGDSLSANDLKPLLAQLSSKGITVHLDVQACYSGGFTSLSRVNSAMAPVCVTADSDSKIVGYGADALIKNTFDVSYQSHFLKYGSQLKAFACSAGADTVNQPNNSLDQVVKRWEKSQSASSLGKFEPVTDLADSNRQMSELATIVNQDDPLYSQRAALISAYKENFLIIMKECSQNRESEVALLKGLLSCVQHPEAKLDKSSASYIEDFLNQPSGVGYDLTMINHHLRFLKFADLTHLTEYKAAFCCLAYDMRTGEVPHFCK